MSKKLEKSEQIWALVHGQVPADESDAQRTTIEADAALASDYASVKALDQRLRNYYASENVALDDLETEILDAYDRDHGELRLAPVEAATGRSDDAIFRVNIWRYGIALAACLAVAMGIQTLRPNDPLSWSDVRVTQATVRSQPQEMRPSSYSEAEVGNFHKTLIGIVNDAYAAQTGNQKGSASTSASVWRLDTEFNEMFEGAFAVTITAQSRLEPNRSVQWSEIFEGADDFGARAADFGHMIAVHLSEDE